MRLGQLQSRWMALVRCTAIICLAAGAAGGAAHARDVAKPAYFSIAPADHKQLQAAYDLMKAQPFVYDTNEIDNYGQRALTLSGEDRIYALWRVLYAYKNDQNEAKLNEWRDRIAVEAQVDKDSALDLLARFMSQAYDNETHGLAGFSDRDWQTYLDAPSPALRAIVTIEKIRQLQHFNQWVDAIDLGDSLILKLEAQGKSAEGVLSIAHQVVSYAFEEVGDTASYSAHSLAFVRLSRNNAFFSQRLDALYDLAFWASRHNDPDMAEKFQALHSQYVRTYKVEDLKTWDEYLCAYVGDQAREYGKVVDCLKGTSVAAGPVRNTVDFLKLKLLADAYAHSGDAVRGRDALARLRAVPDTVSPRDKLYEDMLEANLLQDEGRSREAFLRLDDWAWQKDLKSESARTRSVQAMYSALRKEFDRKTAEAKLLNRQVQMGHLLFGAAAVIVILLSIMMAGGALWVVRMRRMQWRLKDAHGHAEAANAAKSRFLAVMSHELRTPLNGVLGMAQALKKEELTATQHDQVDILIESGETLMVLLNDVLDMSRIEAGKVELAPTPASMKDMIERVINTFAPTVADKALALRYDLDDSASPQMAFDVLRVYQCLSNLVSNAVKFTDNGTVRIIASASRVEGKTGYLVRVEVRDTGIGMNKATLEKLFDAYAQADAGTARKYGGTGLGLSISRRLTELMGGSLSVTSEEGMGSVFVMTFQAGDVVQTAFRSTARVEDGDVSAKGEVQRGRRILLVDDHPVNRKVARLFLEPFGFEITEAADGQEALNCGMENYDLVLMDLNMPHVGGIEATRQFRASEAPGKHLPIIALTADAMPEQIDACLAAGMDAHVSKPILMDKLIAVVSEMLHDDSIDIAKSA